MKIKRKVRNPVDPNRPRDVEGVPIPPSNGEVVYEWFKEMSHKAFGTRIGENPNPDLRKQYVAILGDAQGSPVLYRIRVYAEDRMQALGRVKSIMHWMSTGGFVNGWMPLHNPPDMDLIGHQIQFVHGRVALMDLQEWSEKLEKEWKGNGQKVRV